MWTTVSSRRQGRLRLPMGRGPGEPSVALDRDGMAISRDILFLAVGPSSELRRYGGAPWVGSTDASIGTWIRIEPGHFGEVCSEHDDAELATSAVHAMYSCKDRFMTRCGKSSLTVLSARVEFRPLFGCHGWLASPKPTNLAEYVDDRDPTRSRTHTCLSRQRHAIASHGNDESEPKSARRIECPDIEHFSFYWPACGYRGGRRLC
jgi:hypothetical protein